MDLKHHIGARVKSARLAKGLTQEQLAATLGKAVETISNIERGFAFPGLETVQKIGELLDVRMVFFFEGIEESQHQSAARFHFEEKLRGLGREVADPDLTLVLGLIEAVVRDRR